MIKINQNEENSLINEKRKETLDKLLEKTNWFYSFRYGWTKKDFDRFISWDEISLFVGQDKSKTNYQIIRWMEKEVAIEQQQTKKED